MLILGINDILIGMINFILGSILMVLALAAIGVYSFWGLCGLFRLGCGIGLLAYSSYIVNGLFSKDYA